MTDKTRETIGVVLLNLGGPERLADVEPFLYNLFSDRQIIRLGPAFLQKPLAWLIARRRAPKSRESYRRIGGGSPLTRITAEQGRALEKELQGIGPFKVFMAMRYWHPTAAETLAALQKENIRKIIGLPLYPHYSIATSGSSLIDLKKKAAGLVPEPTIQEISEWPEADDYVNCLAETIREGLAEFTDGPTRVVYSAHSLPVKFIEEGDPYLDQIKRTIKAVEELTGSPGELCFQSRSGPVEWLRPSTPEMLAELAGQGCRNILMVPISFVSDHVETLYEIDLLYKKQAADLGMNLIRSASLNTRPRFIKALKELVLEAASRKGWLTV